METSTTAKMLQALVLCIIFLMLVLYMAQASRHTENIREKFYITGMGLMGLCFVVPLAFTAIGWAIGEYASTDQMPFGIAITTLFIPTAFIIGGITMLAFAREGASIFARRRGMKPRDKWLIQNLPQKESFISRGIAALLIGVFMFSVLLYFLFVEY